MTLYILSSDINIPNSLTNDVFLNWSKLRAIADNKIDVTEKLKFVMVRIENMGKGENACF